MDVLRRGAAWLESQRHAHATQMVEYARGDTSVAVAATLGKTVFQIARDYGGFERTESRDYIVTASELMLAGETVLPLAGDRISEDQNGTRYLYEVMAPGGEPCWRWSDLYRTTLRIHTKFVGTEDL